MRHSSVAICCCLGARGSSTNRTFPWHQRRRFDAKPSSVAGMRTVVGGYTLKHPVGEGSFGKVYCAVKDTGDAIAIKFVLACGSRLRLSSCLKAFASFMNVLLCPYERCYWEPGVAQGRPKGDP